jgi:hypothetical protein
MKRPSVSAAMLLIKGGRPHLRKQKMKHKIWTDFEVYYKWVYIILAAEEG